MVELSSHSVHPFSTTVLFFVCSVCPLGIDLGFQFVGLVLFVSFCSFIWQVLFIHFGTDVAFCSSICNFFHLIIIHLVFVVALCSSICNYFHMLIIHLSLLSCSVRPCRTVVVVCYSSIWSLLSRSVHPFGTVFVCCSSICSFLSRSVRPFENYFRPLFVRFCWFFYRCLLVRSSLPLDSRRPQVLVLFRTRSSLSLSFRFHCCRADLLSFWIWCT